MRKTVIFLLPLLLIGCDKKYNEVVEAYQNNYQVNSVSPADSVRYTAGDSLITIRIDFYSSSQVNEVYCRVIASNGSELTSSYLQLFDNGNSSNGDITADDNSFANKFPLSKYYPNGYYTTKYFVQETHGELRRVAEGKFKYNNGQDNLPPIISNDIVNPDTIMVTDTTTILTSVEANDPNGKNDISKVFFIVYKPNGSTNNNEIQLYDDGDQVKHGDQRAGDGIYSLLIQVDQTNDKGTYRFKFQSRDRSGILSNAINHFVLIQ